mmetsp:Transcript_24647/g.57395  ORF Transcript_24647/g.57395 Transcript_24647/m.57395 type:complete len:307 (+) Transcript_24647:583-1503(+)
MMGVEIVLAALMISLIRGTPRVMFIDATPAKWNVLSVICVPGSPMDWAPTAPTAVPASTCARTYLTRQASRKARSSCGVSHANPTASSSAASAAASAAAAAAVEEAAAGGASLLTPPAPPPPVPPPSSSSSSTMTAARRLPCFGGCAAGVDVTSALTSALTSVFASASALTFALKSGTAEAGGASVAMPSTKATSSRSKRLGSLAMLRWTPLAKAAEVMKSSSTSRSSRCSVRGLAAQRWPRVGALRRRRALAMALRCCSSCRSCSSVRPKLTGRPSFASMFAGSSPSSPYRNWTRLASELRTEPS